MKTADLFVKALEAEGVEYLFAIPGEENLDLANGYAELLGDQSTALGLYQNALADLSSKDDLIRLAGDMAARLDDKAEAAKAYEKAESKITDPNDLASLAKAVYEALGDKAGVRRFASLRVPLDEAVVEAVLDLSGRPFLHYVVDPPGVKILGDPPFDPQLMEEFWRAFVGSAGITLHIDLVRGQTRAPYADRHRHGRGVEDGLELFLTLVDGVGHAFEVVRELVELGHRTARPVARWATHGPVEPAWQPRMSPV